MKRLLAYLLLALSFTFIFNVKADDISDFQIEGISVGDSLLDYFTKKEIRKERKYRIKYPNSNKFTAITFVEYPNLKVYNSIQVNVKNKDKKYIIYSISGIIYFPNNINKCKERMELIANELINIFPDASITKRKKKHEYDKSGKSLIYQTLFDMDSGAEARVECYDWSKKMLKKHDLDDQLVVSLLNDDFSYFMSNEAY